MTLSEIFDSARSAWDYVDFTKIVKSKLTGLPYTQVIDCEVEIRVKDNIPSKDYIDTIGKCANCGVEFHIHKTI